MKYPIGTILKYTPKALQKHPNQFSAEDRYRVTGLNEGEYFRTVNTVNSFYKEGGKSKPIHKAGEIIQKDCRIKFDSFVMEA